MQLFWSIAAVAALTMGAPPLRGENAHVVEMAGAQHMLVLWSDGVVTALGKNGSGRLGRPESFEFQPAARVELPLKAVQVAASEDASFALLEDGTVWAWGEIRNGQLGVAPPKGSTGRHTPEPIPGLRDVASISAEDHMAMAVLRNGTVVAWGKLPAHMTGGVPANLGVPQPIEVAGLTNVVTVTGGSRIGFALTREGRVLAWGLNNLGQLGLGQTSPRESATEIPALKEVVSIARINGTGAAVTRDGRVWTWGHNGQAGLGNGQRADTMDLGQPTPMPVAEISDALEVKGGPISGRHVIVRRRNKTLIGWGNTDWGQLGVGGKAFYPSPTPIKISNVEAYWPFGNYTFARTSDGAMWFWGDQDAAMELLGTKPIQRVPARVAVGKLRGE